MVWVEIWNVGIKGNWMQNRYNEKFDKVVDFLHKMRFDFVSHDVSSDRAVVRTGTHIFVIENCTQKQIEKIKEIIE